MSVRAAILDMDGTLLDSLSIWDTIGEDYLRSLGIVPEPNLSEILRTMSMSQAASYFQEKYGVQKSEEQIVAGIDEMLEDFYRRSVLLKLGAVHLLNTLIQSEIPMLLATATNRDLSEAALKRCGVLDAFEAVLTCSETGHGKDEPQIYQQAAKLLNARPDEILVFEDSLYALNTASQAGFLTAAVFDSHEPNWDEARDLADVALMDLRDLSALQTFLSEEQNRSDDPEHVKFRQ